MKRAQISICFAFLLSLQISLLSAEEPLPAATPVEASQSVISSSETVPEAVVAPSPEAPQTPPEILPAVVAEPTPVPQPPQVDTNDLNASDSEEGVGSGGFNKAVAAVALQPNGRVVVGGQFTNYGGVTVAKGLARLDSKASLDKTFTDNTRLTFAKGEIYALAIQPDGKILAAGNFILHGRGNNDWQALARFYSDGKLDESFGHVLGNGFDNSVLAIAVQANGQVLVGGNFISYAGNTVGGIARLNSDGSLDQAFSRNVGGGIDARGSIKSIVVQADGKILVVGDFTAFSGKKIDGVVRLMPDGYVDMDFYQAVGKSFFVGFPLLEAEDMEQEAGLYLSKAVVQADGHIVLGGEFISYDTNQDIYSSRVLRIDSAGNLDLDFIKKTFEHKFEGDVNSLLIGSDGKIIVGCTSPFSRLETDGSHDKAFYLLAGRAFGGEINSLVLQPDGKVIVGGKFNSYKGIKVGNIVRLNPDGTMDERFISGSYK